MSHHIFIMRNKNIHSMGDGGSMNFTKSDLNIFIMHNKNIVKVIKNLSAPSFFSYAYEKNIGPHSYSHFGSRPCAGFRFWFFYLISGLVA